MNPIDEHMLKPLKSILYANRPKGQTCDRKDKHVIERTNMC